MNIFKADTMVEFLTDNMHRLTWPVQLKTFQVKVHLAVLFIASEYSLQIAGQNLVQRNTIFLSRQLLAKIALCDENKCLEEKPKWIQKIKVS